jgi:putative endonuclease
MVGFPSMKVPCVYIAASQIHGTLYVGVTSNLNQRMRQHVQGLVEGFTKKYAIKMLVYYEMCGSMPEAIAREKQLKKWNRAWKIRIVEGMNPEWTNLFDEATGEIAFGPAESERLMNEPISDGGLDGSPPTRG